MNKDQLKQKLIEEKRRLTDELNRLGERDQGKEASHGNWEVSKHTPIDTADDTELADLFEESSTHEGIVANLEIQRKDVNEALDKIDTDQYGICEVCGNTIEDDRLEANPAARTCKEHIKTK
jgi:RNA polymerase-binding transcription factor DksA